jgi:hypothetical protein
MSELPNGIQEQTQVEDSSQKSSKARISEGEKDQRNYVGLIHFRVDTGWCFRS